MEPFSTSDLLLQQESNKESMIIKQAALFWDPKAECLRIPGIDWPIAWYGVLFSLGFIVGYFLFCKILLFYLRSTPVLNKQESYSPLFVRQYTDHLSFYILLGTVVGARLGHILFYEDIRSYLTHPLSIFKVWEGGLASHGAVAGVFVAVFLFQRKKKVLSFLALLDLLAVVAPFVSFFIRLGNFMNQEILGTPTDLPWAVVFGHPFDGSLPEPRHPVQLYEAFGYLLLGIEFLTLFCFSPFLRKPGRLTGLLLSSLFSFRFIVEFFKEEVSVLPSFLSPFTMGQSLSLVCMGLGIVILNLTLFRGRAVE